MTQAEYIQILLNDCGIDTIKGRNAWLTSMCDREIKYLDTFNPITAPYGPTVEEKSTAINTLKDMKEGRRPRRRDDD